MIELRSKNGREATYIIKTVIGWWIVGRWLAAYMEMILVQSRMRDDVIAIVKKS